MSGDARPPRHRRRLPGTLLQITVSLVLLVLLARRVDLSDAWSAMARLRPATLGAALALTLVGYWGRSVRWTLLLERARVRLGAWDAYRLTLLGNFYGLLTPGRVGEIARVLHLEIPPSRTLPSAIWDRATDVLLLEAMALPAFLAIAAWRGVLLWTYLGLVAATVAGVIALDRAWVPGWVRRRLPGLGAKLDAWSEGARGVLLSGTFVRCLLAGLFFYVFVYAGAWLLLRDVTAGASPKLALSFPVVALLGNLPVAFGGLGLREQVAASMFKAFGAGVAMGPAFSLTWFAVATLVPGLLGVLLRLWPSKPLVEASAPGRGAGLDADSVAEPRAGSAG